MFIQIWSRQKIQSSNISILNLYLSIFLTHANQGMYLAAIQKNQTLGFPRYCHIELNLDLDNE